MYRGTFRASKRPRLTCCKMPKKLSGKVEKVDLYIFAFPGISAAHFAREVQISKSDTKVYKIFQFCRAIFLAPNG